MVLRKAEWRARHSADFICLMWIEEGNVGHRSRYFYLRKHLILCINGKSYPRNSHFRAATLHVTCDCSDHFQTSVNLGQQLLNCNQKHIPHRF
jgi:hypothetical protein